MHYWKTLRFYGDDDGQQCKRGEERTPSLNCNARASATASQLCCSWKTATLPLGGVLPKTASFNTLLFLLTPFLTAVACCSRHSTFFYAHLIVTILHSNQWVRLRSKKPTERGKRRQLITRLTRCSANVLERTGRHFLLTNSKHFLMEKQKDAGRLISAVGNSWQSAGCLQPRPTVKRVNIKESNFWKYRQDIFNWAQGLAAIKQLQSLCLKTRWQEKHKEGSRAGDDSSVTDHTQNTLDVLPVSHDRSRESWSTSSGSEMAELLAAGVGGNTQFFS